MKHKLSVINKWQLSCLQNVLAKQLVANWFLAHIIRSTKLSITLTGWQSLSHTYTHSLTHPLLIATQQHGRIEDYVPDEAALEGDESVEAMKGLFNTVSLWNSEYLMCLH